MRKAASCAAMRAVVLAAGKGSRMQSAKAKVLHQLAGEPLVLYPLRTARRAGVERVVLVVGHQREDVEAAVRSVFAAEFVSFAFQAEQLGTGHAVACALAELSGWHGKVAILSGDVPLLRPETLIRLHDAAERTPTGTAIATFEPSDPTGYGRIIRDPSHRIVAIREHRECTEAEAQIAECNAGVYCIDVDVLREDLPRLDRGNLQGEVYLTDLIELVAARGEVATVSVDAIEVAGVNTSEQLDWLEQQLRARVR